jgi:hypothetical protein
VADGGDGTSWTEDVLHHSLIIRKGIGRIGELICLRKTRACTQGPVYIVLSMCCGRLVH